MGSNIRVPWVGEERPRVIGITGHKRHGKDEVGQVLRETYDYRIVKFAQPLYECIALILGVTVREVEETKDEEAPWLGVTGRHMLETLGTEWGRQMINPAIWILTAHQRVMQAWAEGHNVVITDLRFQNEADAIRSWDASAQLWRVKRPAVPVKYDHASKMDIDHINVDVELKNHSTLTMLWSNVSDVMAMQHQGVWE